MKQYPMYLVKWLDTVVEPDWTYDKDSLTQTPSVVSTLGFLVHREPSFIAIAPSYAADNEAYMLMKIPAGCVIGMQRVRCTGQEEEIVTCLES